MSDDIPSRSASMVQIHHGVAPGSGEYLQAHTLSAGQSGRGSPASNTELVEKKDTASATASADISTPAGVDGATSLVKKEIDVSAESSAANVLASPSVKSVDRSTGTASGAVHTAGIQRIEGIELQRLTSESKAEQSAEQKDGQPAAVALDAPKTDKPEVTTRAASDSDLDVEDLADDDDDDAPPKEGMKHDPNQSPIPEVAACIPTTDDETLPVWTFRFFVLGIILTIFISFMNQFFWYRTTPFVVGILVVQVLSYPLGRLMAVFLPTSKWRVPGLSVRGFELLPEWEFTMNPGPFNLKEHALITMMANTASQTAYAVDIVTIQKLPVYYGQDQGFLYGILLVLTTQFVGYGMAGALRKYLVWPASMVWPANLVNCTLFYTLHKPEERDGWMPRFKYFAIVGCCSFVYYWFPGYFFPVLTSLSFICWAGGGANGGTGSIANGNIVAAQLGSGVAGLGMGAIALDWNQITSYLASPLVSPWWATANILFGFVFFMWFLIPILYYSNVWDAKTFPIYTSRLFNVHGQRFSPTSVMTGGVFDEAKYAAKGPVRMSMVFAFTYGITFAGIAAVITHTILYHGKRIYRQWKQSRVENPDIHHRLMSKYPEVPQWHYISLFVISMVVGMILVEVYTTHMPWYFVIFAVAICAVFVLPIGIIQAVTNQQMGLNVITEFIIGYAWPGRPIANVIFKTFGYISMAQALLFAQDLKLGHYMKIPPRAMFWAQVLGTVIACFTNLLTAYWLMSTIPDICCSSPSAVCAKRNDQWTCPQANTFYSASAIWGLIGPGKVFGGDSPYSACLYFFLVGAIIPIPFYFLKKRFPEVTVFKYIHWPLIFSAMSYLPPAPTVEYPTWCLVGFIFQYLIRKKAYPWFKRYNYVTSAGLDTGLAFSAFVIFMAVQYNPPSGDFFWWGKQDPNAVVPDYNGDECNLASANYYGVDCANYGCALENGVLVPSSG